jgi:hypothetical protein
MAEKQSFSTRLFSKRKSRQKRKIEYFSVSSDASESHQSDSDMDAPYPVRSSLSQRQLNSDGSSVEKLHSLVLKAASERIGNPRGVSKTSSRTHRADQQDAITRNKDLNLKRIMNLSTKEQKSHFAVRTNETIEDYYNDEGCPESENTSESSGRNSPTHVAFPMHSSQLRYEMNDPNEMKARKKISKSRRSNSKEMNQHTKNVFMNLVREESSSAASMSSCSMDSVLNDPMRLEYVRYKLSHPEPPPPPKKISEESDDSSTITPTSCRIFEAWEGVFAMTKSWLFACTSDSSRRRNQ